MSSNGTTPTSFFSFGPGDSYVSKSFQGFKYRNLPTSLQTLVSSAAEVHWAALGPESDSWILSSKDSSGRNTLQWGSAIPQRLRAVLAKTWHSPHLRAFLGPNDSFIIWHPDLIRWGNLPLSLEDSLQAWLTPSGWRVGPPRMVTWGPEGAFFSMSEYGDVVYRLGDDDAWEIYKETVEEWKAEKGFIWSDLAFIALDPTSSDQFIAIRNDGTWAGSIDDGNEDALESFALNFFARAKQKQKPKTQPGQHPNEAKPQPAPNPVTQALYAQWAQDTAAILAAALAALGADRPNPPRKLQIRTEFSSPSPSPVTESTPPISTPSTPGSLLVAFPYLPAGATTCARPACAPVKSDPVGIKACKHDVEAMMRSSGLYSYEWLRQERLRWHPDRFGRLCDEAWREVGRKMAEEMFKIIDALIEESRSAEDRLRSGNGV